ncbi:hypothetical protein [Streptomyces mirabilis]|uniref:hypothetical protein n=1 Tax=Streptomyces mirabilis TaxID=68239 RepID=UPI0036A0AF0C
MLAVGRSAGEGTQGQPNPHLLAVQDRPQPAQDDVVDDALVAQADQGTSLDADQGAAQFKPGAHAGRSRELP